MTLTKNSLTEVYETKIDAARKRFSNSPALSVILDPNVDPQVLEAYLIYYKSLGVAMTEPVESWIRRAGEACKAKGMQEIGKSLCSHAQHEAGHEQMMISDTKALVERWNSKYEPKLDVQQLLDQPLTKGVRDYIKLHEDVIASETPFGQLAIELEIEGLSVRVIPGLMEQFKNILGKDIIQGLSFLEDHMAIDVSHTHFNEKQLNLFLNKYPDSLDALVEAGSKALDAYATFWDDCVELAQKLVAK